jgi:L-fuconolactonase
MVPQLIDTHVHFWNFDPVRDAWIDDSMQIIRRDFLPPDLLNAIADTPISGFVAVQADMSETETHFLLDLAENYSTIKGVVGWLDLCDIGIANRLKTFSQYSNLKGLRHIVQAEPAGFMDRKDFRAGIAQLRDYDLTYDILIYAPQLEEATRLVADFPNQQFVLDHLGKPDIRNRKFEDWAIGIKKLAAHPNCVCKLSGLVTEADWHNWSFATLWPYLETALEAFGPSRLLFGSDWPVCRLAAAYSDVVGLVQQAIDNLSPSEQQLILFENAIQVYNLKP